MDWKMENLKTHGVGRGGGGGGWGGGVGGGGGGAVVYLEYDYYNI